MKQAAIIIALSPVAITAGMICSLSFLIRVAAFCLICYLLRIAKEGQWIEQE